METVSPGHLITRSRQRPEQRLVQSHWGAEASWWGGRPRCGLVEAVGLGP